CVDAMLQLLDLLLRDIEDLIEQVTTPVNRRLLQLFRPLDQLLDALLRQFTNIAECFPAAIDAAQDLLYRGATVLNDAPQHGQPEEAVGPFGLLEDDLGKGHRGEIFAALVVDDPQVLTPANQLGNVVERDVAALLRVVHLAVAVALDEPGHG